MIRVVKPKWKWGQMRLLGRGEAYDQITPAVSMLMRPKHQEISDRPCGHAAVSGTRDAIPFCLSKVYFAYIDLPDFW